MMQIIILGLLLVGYCESQMVVQPPAWPVYWSGFYLQVNTTYPSDLHTAGIITL